MSHFVVAIFDEVADLNDNNVYDKVAKYQETSVSNETKKYLIENGYATRMCGHCNKELKEGFCTCEPDNTEDSMIWHNKDSFWDWFQIGGRYEDYQEILKGSKLKDLTIDQKDLLINSTFGYIDLENNYISVGNMGWWAMSDETEESEKAYKEKLEEFIKANPELYITIVDFHV